MGDREIVLSPKGGLANRLRALAGFRALSEVLKVPLLLYWDPDPTCNAAFTDLFETTGWESVRLIGAVEAAERRASNPADYHRSSDIIVEVWRRHAQSLCSVDDFSRLSLAHLRSLRPRPELRAKVNGFAEAHKLAECTGVQIRMTDNVSAYEYWSKNDPSFKPEKISRIEGFDKVVRTLAERGENAFVCTDNEAVAEALRATFSNLVFYPKEYARRPRLFSRVILRVRSALGRQEPQSIRTTAVSDALIDMLLLARCRCVVGTYYSSFGVVGALIGGVPLYWLEGTDVVDGGEMRPQSPTPP